MTLYSRRKRFDGLSESIGKKFSKAGLSPNQWTLLSIPLALISGYMLSQGLFAFGAAFLIMAAFLDMVDGAVARHTGKVGKKGAFLERITDRYVEGIILFSLLLAGLPGFFLPSFAWIFLLMFGGILTSYSKAAAEKEIVQDLRGGIIERAERLVGLFIGIILAVFNPIYLTWAIALLAVLANVSAIQRIWKAWNANE